MSHTTLRSGYTELVERLNRFPQGAPPSDTLYKILKILLSEREALDELSSRAILVDVEWDGKTTYTHPAAHQASHGKSAGEIALHGEHLIARFTG